MTSQNGHRFLLFTFDTEYSSMSSVWYYTLDLEWMYNWLEINENKLKPRTLWYIDDDQINIYTACDCIYICDGIKSGQ